MDIPEITYYRPTEDTGREVGNSNLVKRLQRGVPAFLSLMPHKYSVVPLRLSSMHLKDTSRNIPNSQAAQRLFRKSKLTTSVHPCPTFLSSLTSHSASYGQGCLFLPDASNVCHDVQQELKQAVNLESMASQAQDKVCKGKLQRPKVMLK